MTRLDGDTVQEAEATQPGIKILLPPRIIAGKFREVDRGSHAFNIQSCGIARSVSLVMVDETAALLLLPLKQPIADFKDQVRKFGVALDAGPYAEGLHQPCHLAKITQITE